MKKLIPILFALLLLTSCEKENCWKCQFVSMTKGDITKEYCDKTQEEIVKIEQDMADQGYASSCVPL